MLLCDSGVDVSSSLLLASAILMAVREQLFHSSRCLNFRNRLIGRDIDRPIVRVAAVLSGCVFKGREHHGRVVSGIGSDRPGTEIPRIRPSIRIVSVIRRSRYFHASIRVRQFPVAHAFEHGDIWDWTVAECSEAAWRVYELVVSKNAEASTAAQNAFNVVLERQFSIVVVDSVGLVIRLAGKVFRDGGVVQLQSSVVNSQSLTLLVVDFAIGNWVELGGV